MIFSMQHMLGGESKIFSECNAPKLLTSENTIVGSTYDNRWFWIDHVLTLPIGGIVQTDFQTITRLE